MFVDIKKVELEYTNEEKNIALNAMCIQNS